MRNILLLLLVTLISFFAIAQDAPVVIAPVIVPDTAVIVNVIKVKPKFKFGGDGIYLRDSTWKLGGFIGLTVSQTALYQWAPGGNNNFAILFGANFYANHKKGRLMWDNSFDAKWGMVANGKIRSKELARSNLQKSIDLFALRSILGYELKKNLFASLKLGFESQFSPTYDYSLTDTSGGGFRRYTVSKFAAPAVLTLGAGLTWKPKDYFTLYFSPATGKMTFVTKDNPGRDTTTLPDGRFTDAYYSDVDETRFGLERGAGLMAEFGWELDILFQKDIVKNVNWKSHLNVFGAYLNPKYNTQLPEYFADQDSMGLITINETTKHIPVVKWENDIVFKVNAWLSATLSTKFVFQYNAQVPLDKYKNDSETRAKGPDGITDKDKFGNTVTGYKKLQIFEQFGLGLSFKF
jgi:hypothetical protein